MWKRLIPIVVGVGAIILGNVLTIAVAKEGDASSIAHTRGKQVFTKHCAGCHGPEGKGDGYRLLGADPANLTRSSIKKKPDALLLQTIHEGKPNMPSWKGRLSEADSQAVLVYIRTLRK